MLGKPRKRQLTPPNFRRTLAPSIMARGNSQKPSDGSGLDFEVQLWAAAGQAVPAAHLTMMEYKTLPSGKSNCSNRRKRWPCASTSGGMFVSSEKFVEKHGGREGDIAVYRRKSNFAISQLSSLNLLN